MHLQSKTMHTKCIFVKLKSVPNKHSLSKLELLRTYKCPKIQFTNRKTFGEILIFKILLFQKRSNFNLTFEHRSNDQTICGWYFWLVW